MNLQKFFQQWNNRPCDVDGVFGPQCVDIVKQYFKDVLNLPIIKGNAIDYWKDLPGFIRIKNSPVNSPNPGDLIIWNIGIYGHIGITNWSNLFFFNCFEQNNPIGSMCHFGTHGYGKVLGWQHWTGGAL